MGFERTEYEFNESVGFLPDSVYIVRENPVTVSSEFDIIVLLQPQSTATDGQGGKCYMIMRGAIYRRDQQILKHIYMFDCVLIHKTDIHMRHPSQWVYGLCV